IIRYATESLIIDEEWIREFNELVSTIEES
ncbi:unnamed protein product, partial [marine sediment metagenome]